MMHSLARQVKVAHFWQDSRNLLDASVHGISLESIPIESGSRFGVAKKLPLESPLATALPSH